MQIITIDNLIFKKTISRTLIIWVTGNIFTTAVPLVVGMETCMTPGVGRGDGDSPSNQCSANAHGPHWLVSSLLEESETLVFQICLQLEIFLWLSTRNIQQTSHKLSNFCVQRTASLWFPPPLTLSHSPLEGSSTIDPASHITSWQSPGPVDSSFVYLSLFSNSHF